MNQFNVRKTVIESYRNLCEAAFNLEERLNMIEAEKEQVVEEKMALLLCYEDVQKQTRTLIEENAKLKSRLDSVNEYAKELGEEIFKAEGSK